jgi:hypothetical protein
VVALNLKSAVRNTLGCSSLLISIALDPGDGSKDTLQLRDSDVVTALLISSRPQV